MIIRRLTLVKYPLELSTEYKGKPLRGTENVFPELGVRNQVFEADSDWLKDITFKLKNISDKTITYIALFLHFPETAKEKPSTALELPSTNLNTSRRGTGLHQIFLGVDPDRKFQRPELRLAPGETLEIPLAPEYLDISTLVRLLELRIEQVSQMEVEIHSALFNDGSFFEAGMMYRRDPQNPHKWLPIPQKP